MIWIVWALCLIFFGVVAGVVGFSFDMLGYAIVGGIMVLAGIALLVPMRRHWREFFNKRDTA